MSATNPKSPLLDIEFYIDAAKKHGDDAEADHEVGDLQDFLRAMWERLTAEQRLQFARNEKVHATLEAALVDVEAEVAKLPWIRWKPRTKCGVFMNDRPVLIAATLRLRPAIESAALA